MLPVNNVIKNLRYKTDFIALTFDQTVVFYYFKKERSKLSSEFLKAPFDINRVGSGCIIHKIDFGEV